MTASARPASSARIWLGPLMMLGGAIAIGFAPIGLRLSHFGPQATAFWRFIFALPMLAALIYGLGGRIGRPSLFAIVSGVFFGVDIALWHTSLKLTSVANATFLVNLGSASVGLIAWVALKERPHRIWIIAAPIALTGALLLSRGAGSISEGTLAGDLLALGAAVMVSLSIFFTKLARRAETGLHILFWATIAEAVVAAIASGVTRESLIPPDASWLLAPLALAAIAHSTGQALIAVGVGRTPAAAAGVLLLVQPVTSAILAWRLFGEVLTPVQIAGAALVLLGVWLAGRR
ncbi:MAG: EamA family transporter [Alphaproteobacteria bacterium]|nr:EamA family transporter [Alphaproteobacteria bacterium]